MGAGTSCAVESTTGGPLVPSIAALGALCQAAVANLGKNHEQAYELMVKACRESLAGRNIAREPNVEDVLSSVRGKLEAMTDADTLAGVDRQAMDAIEEAIRTTIAQAATPDEGNIPPVLPHHSVAQWINRIDRHYAIELFTTNYDTIIERGLESERVPLFDGFVGSREPFFEPSALAHEGSAPAQRWTRLWKVHGSVNWHRANDDHGRIVRTTESLTGELIFPSLHKYDESRKQPFVAMLQRLKDILHRREDTVLFVLGYAWGDEHINEVIFDALSVRERTHVIALQYEELPDDHQLVKRGKSRHNLVVYGPETALIGGERLIWRLAEPVDDRTANLLDVPFDSDAQKEDEPPLGGRMRLGDFSQFARFINDIAASHG